MELTTENPENLDDLYGHLLSDSEPDVVAEIAESMRRNGYQGDPIIVTQLLEVISGRHRTLAARQAGLDSVPVVVLDADEFENLERECLDLEDLAAVVMERLEG